MRLDRELTPVELDAFAAELDELRRELGPTAPTLTGKGDWTYSPATH